MRRKLRGAALMIFLILLMVGSLAYVVSGFTPAELDARRNKKTEEALAQARDALVGHALQYREQQVKTGTLDAMYGYLPMPDVGTSRFHASQSPACNIEGCAMSFINGAFPADTETIIGRFPWRTLGLEPLRDGHGECLWYVVSANHKSLGISPTVRMNWDSLSHLDVVVANGSATLASQLSSAHQRPVAVIFSPGPMLPGQDRRPLGGDDVTHCRGNYDAANYLDPATAAALGGVTNYFSGATNNASGVTDPNTPKQLSFRGKVFSTGSAILPHGCPGSGCELVANDRGLELTGDKLFTEIRKNAYFRTDINAMLDRMVNCLRDQSLGSGYADRIADDACYDSGQNPQGYYDHYKELVFLAKPAGAFTVNGDGSCAAALLFAGQRNASQQRATAAQKSDFSKYLEGSNYPLTGTAFSGATLFDRSPPQAPEQDIVRCIPASPTFTPVTSSVLTSQGFGQLVAYDAATRTLTLGRQDVTTGMGATASALFGCAWVSEAKALGSGLRAYFRFQFMEVGSSVGSNGFVFAIADALGNTIASCGAAGNHLGYSGDNGSTPKIAYPKLGIEFDQGRNWVLPSGFSESATNPGRNDPCGTSGCGGTAGYNSHAAIVYWGHESANASDAVTLPDSDDNAHGFPSAGSLAGPRLPPRSHVDPASETGIKFVNLRGDPDDSKQFHVRVEITPARSPNADALLSSTSLYTQVWIEGNSALTDQIAALKNTTRPMSLLYPGYAATLSDTAALYDVQEAACSSGICPSGQACGSDGNCYRPALQNVLLGFTGSQRTTDQEVHITETFATWLP